MKKLLFTDLDGTLLDLHTYSAEQVKGAVATLKQQGVSIIFCSSKTWAEQEFYLKELGLDEPVIVENGSGIILPDNSNLQLQGATNTIRGKKATVLGQTYSEVVRAIERSAKTLGADFKYYHNQTLEEIAMITGLSEQGAVKAKSRDFSETLFNADRASKTFQLFTEEIESKGFLCMPGSKFITITGGGCDKGKAVQLLINAYRQYDPAVISYGIGDSRNDQEMLNAVDHAFLVQKPDLSWAEVDVAGLRKIEGIGPQGWIMVAEEILGA